ncbi:hypothetical protein ES703_74882 [subsurface metagenome]
MNIVNESARTIPSVGSSLEMAAVYRDMHDFTRKDMPNAVVMQRSMPSKPAFQVEETLLDSRGVHRFG